MGRFRLTARRAWLSWENFTLLAVAAVSVPSLDGVWEPSGVDGFWRAAAAWYVFVSALILLIQPARISLLQTVAWFCLAAGCAAFVATSAVGWFWGVLAIGALVQGVRTARGTRHHATVEDTQAWTATR